MHLRPRLLCGTVAVAWVVVSSGCSASNKSPMATVTVTPAVELHDGQQVEVTVSGFPHLGEKVFLSECASVAVVNKEGCGEQLAGQVFFLTDDHGTGKASFVVSDSASSGPLYAPRLACSTGCVLVATVGAVSGSHEIAWTTLRFLTPSPVPGPGVRGYQVGQFACSSALKPGAAVVLPPSSISELLLCPLPDQSAQPVTLTPNSPAFIPLLMALASPDAPPSQGACPASLIITPPIVARSTSGIALIKLPADDCNFPQATVRAAINQALTG